MKKGSKILILILFLTILQDINTTCYSQSKGVSIQDILIKIDSLQQHKNTGQDQGGIPSLRRYHYGSTYKEDNNLFFTSLVLYTIGRYQTLLSKEEQLIYDQIKAGALPYIQKFQNKNGLTYNFWPKYPAQFFPNSWLNNYRNINALADDVDDCAITYMALGIDSIKAIALRNKFQDFSNGKNKYSKGFYNKYNTSPVYTTWLGNGYPIDIDICVISNVLCFNSRYQFEYNNIDSSSLDLLVDLVKSNKHLNDAQYISQYYVNSATIIYHLAKLMQSIHYKDLDALMPQLISDAKRIFIKSKYPLEKLLLSNALLQFGETDTKYHFMNEDALLQNDYPYFEANMSAYANNPLKRIVAASKIGKFKFYSYGFNLSLLLEHKMLLERKRSNH